MDFVGTFRAIAAAAIAFVPPAIAQDLLKDSPASDWRELDPENTLYLELPAGRVVIELAPAYAPANVAAIRKLLRQRYFDGSVVLRVQDNYVVQWARPEDDPRAKAMAAVKVKPEFSRPVDPGLEFTPLPYPDTYAPEVGFSQGFAAARDAKRGETWLVHCYGSVGVGRDDDADSGNGSELYAVIGQSPRGPAPMGFYEKPSQRIPIASARLAADVPEAGRLRLEALRTDSATFKAYIASRATRKESWFKDPIGRIGVCNMPLPVRVKGS
ncbi:MAG TPA: peptidylprolyl isomerase [Usitatibacter sp.]|nr:peptidylprolyl isomerase [Usitatibacter sp.]